MGHIEKLKNLCKSNEKDVGRNFESTGGFDQTIKDFDALDPTDVKEIQTQ